MPKPNASLCIAILCLQFTAGQAYFSFNVYNFHEWGIWRQKLGVCPQAVECWQPLSYRHTQHYQCFYDLECPGQYKCCVNSCYVHKVCLKPKESDIINIDDEEDDEIINGSGNYGL